MHPYFFSHPLPARPGEIPWFEDSHELDRRKFRGQRAAMPPAPPGGSVGIGPNGGWANSGARAGPENRNSRIPGAASRVGKSNPPGGHGSFFRRTLDNRGNEMHSMRTRQGNEGTNQSLPLSQRESGLPPKPPLPTPTHQTWGGNQSNRSARDRTRFSSRLDGNVDSYIPSYSGMGERIRGRDGDSPSSTTEYRDTKLEQSHQAARRDNYRDYTSRKRSRSPVMKNGGRNTDRELYRR